MASMPIVCQGLDDKRELHLTTPSDYAKLDSEVLSAEEGPVMLRLDVTYDEHTLGTFTPLLWEKGPVCLCCSLLRWKAAVDKADVAGNAGYSDLSGWPLPSS